MSMYLHVEYFDTDASSYIHRLKLPLKATDSFRVGEANILYVEHADGTTHFVPLSNVRQYYANTDSPSNQGQNSIQEPNHGRL